MQQPGWYLRRLKRMSGAEVAYRLSRSVRVVSAHLVPVRMPARDELATDLRFLPPFFALSPDALLAAADRVLAGRYAFFDLDDCDLGDPPQWNRDPLTHRVAAVRRATSIDYRDEREVGNIKYCGKRTDICIWRHWRRRTRLRETPAMRSPSSSRSIRGSHN